jgi:hypothetical protein
MFDQDDAALKEAGVLLRLYPDEGSCYRKGTHFIWASKFGNRPYRTPQKMIKDIKRELRRVARKNV